MMPQAMMKLAKLVFINLLILLVLVEGLALGLYFMKHSALFYADSSGVTIALEEDDTRDELEVTKLLHPYFGYLNTRPGAGPSYLPANNYGFLSEERDYPWQKTDPKQYVVGLFGGSVAQQVYVKGRQKLIEYLQQQPGLSDREIIVLAFTQPGYKQPQQLQLLSYFLSKGQEFDAVVNLDGFNEMALAVQNHQRGVDISMPSSGHMLQMMDALGQSVMTSQKVEALASISQFKRRINQSVQTANTARLASVNLAIRMYHQWLSKHYSMALSDYQSIETKAAKQSVFYLNKATAGPAYSDDLFTRIAEYWVRSSGLMKQLAEANNVLYLHVLQPNQYHSKRKFSEEEAKVALYERHIYKKAAEQGYPYLVQQFEALEQSGVNFYSALELMDSEPKQVYADSCCHFTRLGAEMLGTYIGTLIAENYSQ